MDIFIGGIVYVLKVVWDKVDKKLKEMYMFYYELIDNYRGYEGV